jgi:mono/diheme cytochrome c family protein
MRWRVVLPVVSVVVLVSTGAASAQDRSETVVRGEKLFMTHGCYGCHTVGKVGSPIGPDLSKVGGKYTLRDMARWLQDPAAQQPTAHMPRLQIPPGEVDALAAYLASLR